MSQKNTILLTISKIRHSFKMGAYRLGTGAYGSEGAMRARPRGSSDGRTRRGEERSYTKREKGRTRKIKINLPFKKQVDFLPTRTPHCEFSPALRLAGLPKTPAGREGASFALFFRLTFSKPTPPLPAQQPAHRPIGKSASWLFL